MTVLDEMILKAHAVRERAYAPYSNCHVGVCLRTASGDLFCGCNVENAAYGQTQCAEAAAIANMVASLGAQPIAEVVVVPFSPCGACRQLLREFAPMDAKIHIVQGQTQLKTLTMSELLPYSFGPEALQENVS